MFIIDVVNALTTHKVPYAIVGGYAVALHGAVRGTVDIDLVIALDRDTYQRAETALGSLALKPRLPVTAAEIFDFREEYIQNRNLTAWSFFNPNNPLQIVDILVTEDLARLTTVTKSAYGRKLRIVSIQDLIRMKRKSARPQDLADIEALEKLA